MCFHSDVCDIVRSRLCKARSHNNHNNHNHNNNPNNPNPG